MLFLPYDVASVARIPEAVRSHFNRRVYLPHRSKYDNIVFDISITSHRNTPSVNQRHLKRSFLRRCVENRNRRFFVNQQNDNTIPEIKSGK